MFIGLRCLLTAKWVPIWLFHPSLTGTIGFTNARNWLKDVRQHADPHLTCILVGNKVDLCSEDAGSHKRAREVTTEEAELFAKQEGLLFVEASAKSGQNVEVAFEQATKDILAKIRTGVFDDDRVCLRYLPLQMIHSHGFSPLASRRRNRTP